ncbi:MAG TPA: DUF3108 domain-containing protein [Wenzhouxiangellaceae bacterium]|nr:DUF3108 domain-containing protein [Wenzhouxiangellaceae bacterium]
MIAISMTLGACSALAAESPPFQPYQASYAVTRGNSEIGRVDVELSQRRDGLWHYVIESQATAWYIKMLGISTSETSWVQWYRDRVLPLTYHHVSREPGSDRFWQHSYDWQEMQTETRTHEGDLTVQLTSGVVDPLSLRLAAVVRIAEQAPNFESFTMQVLERDEIEQQEYRYNGTEMLEIDGRCYRTAVFKRFRKEGSSRNYTAWHAESLGWMPVRIAHEDDGKPISLTLKEWHSSSIDLPAPLPCNPPSNGERQSQQD